NCYAPFTIVAHHLSPSRSTRAACYACSRVASHVDSPRARGRTRTHASSMSIMAERTSIDIDELREVWWMLSAEDRLEGFRLLGAGEAGEFFSDLDPHDQAELILALRPQERRTWLRLLAP